MSPTGSVKAVRSLEIELRVIVTYWRLGMAWRWSSDQLARCGKCPNCDSLVVELLRQSRGPA
jgi:hypothetical protein